MDLQGCCSVLFRGLGTELTESPSEQFSYIYSFSSSLQELSPGTSLPMHALLSTQEVSGPLLGLLLVCPLLHLPTASQGGRCTDCLSTWVSKEPQRSHPLCKRKTESWLLMQPPALTLMI